MDLEIWVLVYLFLAIIFISGVGYYCSTQMEIKEEFCNQTCGQYIKSNGNEYCLKDDVSIPIIFKCTGLFDVQCKLFYIKNGV